MPEPIHATDAEARRWARNLRQSAPPAPPSPLDAVRAALVAQVEASRRMAEEAIHPAARAYQHGHAAGVGQALAIVDQVLGEGE